MHVCLRNMLAGLLAVALVASVAGCGGGGGTSGQDEGAASGEPIKIGAVLSLTGSYAALGESNKNAIDLEVKRINDAGGIDGRPIEVIIEDDATEDAQSNAAASKLIEQDGVVAIIGASGTGGTMAMRQVLQRAGVPQISMAGGTVITAQFDPLVFQTPWSNTIVVPRVLQAIKDDGATKVALISDSGGYGKDGRDVILKAAPEAGIEIVSDQTYNPGDTDMTAQLTKMKDSGAQAILLWGAGKEAVTVVKNAADLKVDLPLYGGSGQARKEFIEGAGEAAEGFTFATGKSLVPENWPTDSEQYKVVSDFAKRYEAAYGEKPDIFAGHALDAMLILEAALKKAGGDDPKAIRDAIEQTSGLAGFGGAFTFSPTDHNGLTADDLALYRVQGGAWVPVK